MSHEYEELEDGYTYGIRKMEGVHIDGYLCEVITPLHRSYTARCSSLSVARSWCRRIIGRDRKSPLQPLNAPFVREREG